MSITSGSLNGVPLIWVNCVLPVSNTPPPLIIHLAPKNKRSLYGAISNIRRWWLFHTSMKGLHKGGPCLWTLLNGIMEGLSKLLLMPMSMDGDIVCFTGYLTGSEACTRCSGSSAWGLARASSSWFTIRVWGRDLY